MLTAEEFRRLALAFEGATEGAHMNHPDFRANGRIFATLRGDDEWGMVKVAPEEQQTLLRQHPGLFEPASGAWGRQGSTMVRLAAADVRTVRAAMTLAFNGVMATRPSRRTTAGKARRSPSIRSR